LPDRVNVAVPSCSRRPWLSGGLMLQFIYTCSGNGYAAPAALPVLQVIHRKGTRGRQHPGCEALRSVSVLGSARRSTTYSGMQPRSVIQRRSVIQLGPGAPSAAEAAAPCRSSAPGALHGAARSRPDLAARTVYRQPVHRQPVYRQPVHRQPMHPLPVERSRHRGTSVLQWQMCHAPSTSTPLVHGTDRAGGHMQTRNPSGTPHDSPSFELPSALAICANGAARENAEAVHHGAAKAVRRGPRALIAGSIAEEREHRARARGDSAGIVWGRFLDNVETCEDHPRQVSRCLTESPRPSLESHLCIEGDRRVQRTQAGTRQ